MTAILATFSDVQIVKSRSVMILKMEVPLERADQALTALGGVPQPGSERWVGVAPVQSDAIEARPQGKPRFHEMKPSQQAALRCRQRDFQVWIGAEDEADAAMRIRRRCKVDSRSALDADAEAAQTWASIETDFLNKDYVR